MPKPNMNMVGLKNGIIEFDESMLPYEAVRHIVALAQISGCSATEIRGWVDIAIDTVKNGGHINMNAKSLRDAIVQPDPFKKMRESIKKFNNIWG